MSLRTRTLLPLFAALLLAGPAPAQVSLWKLGGDGLEWAA